MRVPARLATNIVESATILCSSEIIGLFKDLSNLNFNIMDELTAPLAISDDFISVIESGVTLALIWYLINDNQKIRNISTLMDSSIQAANIFLLYEFAQYFLKSEVVPIYYLCTQLLLSFIGIFLYRKYREENDSFIL